MIFNILLIGFTTTTQFFWDIGRRFARKRVVSQLTVTPFSDGKVNEIIFGVHSWRHDTAGQMFLEHLDANWYNTFCALPNRGRFTGFERVTIGVDTGWSDTSSNIIEDLLPISEINAGKIINVREIVPKGTDFYSLTCTGYPGYNVSPKKIAWGKVYHT